MGVFFWEPLAVADWGWMAALSVTGALGHFCLIKAYEMAEVSIIQPFAYFQLVFASLIGILVFAETMQSRVVLGAVIVVAAGLFTLFRENRKKA